MTTAPPFLLDAIIDDKTGEVDIGTLIHGIEALEAQVNAITFIETGKQLEYCHPIQSPATKNVWNPAIFTKVDRLVKTKTIRFIKKCDIPRGEKAVYTRIVVAIRPSKQFTSDCGYAREETKWRA